MHFLGIVFVCIGVLGMLLGLACKFYAYKKHDGKWDECAHDTAGRGIMVLIIGILILIFTAGK